MTGPDRGRSIVRMIALSLLMCGAALAPPSLAQEGQSATTPANCHWQNSPTAGDGRAELWCKGSDLRYHPTGRFRDQGRDDFTAGCPGRQVYDGLRCRDEDAVLADSLRPSPGAAQAPAAIPPNLRGAAATLDQLIAYDSRGWMMNRYDPGSVRAVRYLSRARGGQDGVLYGEYSYNGGTVGWVKARLEGGVFSCIEYHDFQGRCRPIGRSSYAYDLLGGLVIAALVEAASTPSSGSNPYAECLDRAGPDHADANDCHKRYRR